MDRLSPKQLRDIQSAVQNVYPEQEVEENYSELDQQIAEMLVEFVKSLDEEQLKTIREETLDEGVLGRIGSFVAKNTPKALRAITGFGRTGTLADLQKGATAVTTTNAITDPVKTGLDILGGVENVTRAARAFVGQGVPAKDSSKQSSNRDDYVLRDGKWYRK